MTGKILHLPAPIREQLNLRLDDGTSGKQALKWLNAQPEVKAILKQHFDGKPINSQNLSDYRHNAFKLWKMRQAALQFAAQAADARSAGPPTDQAVLLDNFVHYLLMRLAAAAQASSLCDDAHLELRQIREFLTDIVALRRGELVSRRLNLEQQRISLLQTKSQQELDELFWQWTRRPDINAKLFPHRDPEKQRRRVFELIDEHLLGVRPKAPDPEPDPLAYI